MAPLFRDHNDNGPHPVHPRRSPSSSRRTLSSLRTSSSSPTSLLLLLALLAATSTCTTSVVATDPHQRQLVITNNSPSDAVGIYWVDPQTYDLIKVGQDVTRGETRAFETFVGHEFDILEHPSTTASSSSATGVGEESMRGICTGSNMQCQGVHYRVSDLKEQVLLLDDNFALVHRNTSQVGSFSSSSSENGADNHQSLHGHNKKQRQGKDDSSKVDDFNRKVTVVNRSSGDIEVYWINPQSGRIEPRTKLVVGKKSKTMLNTYVGHGFEVYEVVDRSSSSSYVGKTARFHVAEERNQGFFIATDLSIRYYDPSKLDPAYGENTQKRNFTLTNISPYRADLNYIDEFGEYHSATSLPLEIGQSRTFFSQVGHWFELRELPNKETKECHSGGGYFDCYRTKFRVLEDEVQSLIVRGDDFALGGLMKFDWNENNTYIEVVPMDAKPPPTVDIPETTLPMSACRTRATEDLSRLTMGRHSSAETAEKLLDELVSCLQDNATAQFQQRKDHLAIEVLQRQTVANTFEYYTCQDDDLPTSEPIERTTWENKGINHAVDILLHRNASKVHIVKDFATEEECQAMEEKAKPNLGVAGVADGNGGTRITSFRKALQAGIQVDWSKEADGDHIAAVSRRVYDYTNHVLGLDIDEHGQENLMSIQYKGRGDNETEPDQYMPHCDGDCAGKRHREGTRMSTMIVYCTIAERGGATNFKNAALHVRPEKRAAVFFSYMDPESMTMDNAFTTHSGCPVREGEKKLITQWIRYGVDIENPSHKYNSLGVREDDQPMGATCNDASSGWFMGDYEITETMTKFKEEESFGAVFKKV